MTQWKQPDHNIKITIQYSIYDNIPEFWIDYDNNCYPDLFCDDHGNVMRYVFFLHR